MNIDIDGLQAFVRVAELSTFRQAAEMLHVSQPVLSRRISKLETFLGIRLFDRTTRRVLLTPVGKKFLPQAKSLVDELEGAFTNLKDLGKYGGPGYVTLACIPTATHLLQAVTSKYWAAHPSHRIRILDIHGNRVSQAVLRGKAEFGISVMKEYGPEIEFKRLFDDPYVLACRRDHTLAKRKTVKWEELGDYPLISVGLLSGYRMQANYPPLKAAIRRSGLCEVRHSFWTGLSMVEAGIGVAPVPRLAFSRSKHSTLVYRTLVAPVLSRTIGILRLRNTRLSTAAEEFLALFKDRYTT